MKKTFEAETQAAAVKEAEEWWTAQSGLRQTQRTIVATGSDGPALGAMDRWAVTIHYEASSA
jgi:hypothetical protein